MMFLEYQISIQLVFHAPIKIWHLCKKWQISKLALLNQKYKSALENFQSPASLHALPLCKIKNFSLSLSLSRTCTAAHTGTSIYSLSLNSKAWQPLPSIASGDGDTLSNITNFNQTCLYLVRKCSKSSLLLIVSNPQRRKFSHCFQHLTLQEGLLLLFSVFWIFFLQRCILFRFFFFFN